TTKGFLDHFNLKSLDELPPLAELRELEPDPILDFDDAPVPAHLQALADESAEPEEPKDETSFRTLLTELDSMEEGLKTDFDDLLRDVAPVEALEPEPEPEPEIEAQPQPQQPSAAELARERLRAAVAALEQRSALSDEEIEAQALAEAIEQERREQED
ncbi:MAG: SMC-Scp complex subunit ScpB, partial [Pseudomonas sp.]|nr:SMC-Scp complex subunit ScpB [Pseudomonas sp.]